MQKKYKDLIIIIPSFNELNSLKKILKLDKYYNVLIIDDCSTDKTLNYLTKNKINFLKNKKNLGYEKTLLKGFKYVINKYKFILTCDADGEHSIKDIKRFIKLSRYKKDLIIGNRNIKPFLENYICKIYYTFKGIRDPLCGLKLYKISKIKKEINEKNFENYLVNLLNKINLKNLNIENKKIFVNKRIFGKSKIKFKLNYYFTLIKILFLSFT